MWRTGRIPGRQNHERRWLRIPRQPHSRYRRRLHRGQCPRLARHSLGRNNCRTCRNRCHRRLPADMGYFPYQKEIIRSKYRLHAGQVENAYPKEVTQGLPYQHIEGATQGRQFVKATCLALASMFFMPK